MPGVKKLKCLILPVVNMNTQPSLCYYVPLDIWRYTDVFGLIAGLIF